MFCCLHLWHHRPLSSCWIESPDRRSLLCRHRVLRADGAAFSEISSFSDSGRIPPTPGSIHLPYASRLMFERHHPQSLQEWYLSGSSRCLVYETSRTSSLPGCCRRKKEHSLSLLSIGILRLGREDQRLIRTGWPEYAATARLSLLRSRFASNFWNHERRGKQRCLSCAADEIDIRLCCVCVCVCVFVFVFVFVCACASQLFSSKVSSSPIHWIICYEYNQTTRVNNLLLSLPLYLSYVHKYIL